MTEQTEQTERARAHDPQCVRTNGEVTVSASPVLEVASHTTRCSPSTTLCFVSSLSADIFRLRQR